MARPELDFATNLARQAGAIMRQNFRLGMAKEWKGDGTPLTATDTQINQLVLDAVAREFPDHAVLAEEGSRSIDGAEFTWVCDPVDGTIPFSHGIPTFTFSLALTQHGQSILGVVLDPMLDRLFVAESGRGSSLNGRPVRVNDHRTIEHGLFYVNNWWGGAYHLGAVDEAVRARGGLVINLLSIAYGTALVASGELTGVIFPGSSPWDGAAIAVIVREAGGRVTDLAGNDQPYDQPTKGFIASNGLVHDELVALVAEHIQSDG